MQTGQYMQLQTIKINCNSQPLQQRHECTGLDT